MSSSQLETKLEDLPLHSLYSLLRPISVPAKRARFNNWGRAFYCTPLAIFEPESQLQCKLVLELARREGKTVRAVGVGHSPSDLACTNGYMVRLTKMNHLIQVSTPSALLMVDPGPDILVSRRLSTISFSLSFAVPINYIMTYSRALFSFHHFDLYLG
jgi:L-gulonolactone oxidase